MKLKLKPVIFLFFLLFLQQNGIAQTEDDSAYCSCNDSITFSQEGKKDSIALLKYIGIDALINTLGIDTLQNPLVLNFESSIFKFSYMIKINDIYYLKLFPYFPENFYYDYLTEDPRNQTKLKVKCLYLYKYKNCLDNHITLKRYNKDNNYYEVLIPQ